jgi:hypothetical protein
MLTNAADDNCTCFERQPAACSACRTVRACTGTSCRLHPFVRCQHSPEHRNHCVEGVPKHPWVAFYSGQINWQAHRYTAVVTPHDAAGTKRPKLKLTDPQLSMKVRRNHETSFSMRASTENHYITADPTEHRMA